mgnify:FL=1
MLDPISILGIASTAFATLKKGFEFGKDAESMVKDLGRFMHSVDDLKSLHKRKKKRQFGNIEEESLETYVALKKARKMEDELRNFMIASYGVTAWTDILAIQARLRKERREAQIKKQKEQEEVIKIALVIFTIIILGGIGIFGYFFVYK